MNTATPAPTELDATYTTGETVLLTLASQRGGYTADPFERSTERVKVYLRCVGVGDLEVSIEGVAQFVYACSEGNDPGTLNSFDVRYVDMLSIRVAADESQLWALAVTGVPLDA